MLQVFFRSHLAEAEQASNALLVSVEASERVLPFPLDLTLEGLGSHGWILLRTSRCTYACRCGSDWRLIGAQDGAEWQTRRMVAVASKSRFVTCHAFSPHIAVSDPA